MMIKKVGLVTWNGSYNYGTNLQAYALYTTIHSLGFDTYMLRYFSVEEHTCFGYLKAVYLKWKYRIKKRPTPSTFGMHPVKMKRIEDFVNHNFVYSKPQKSNTSFKQSLKDTDCIITGSDQIWNPYYLKLFYLLPMIGKSIRKVSYASSIGVQEIPLKMQPIYKKYLRRFDHLSLRERIGAEIIANITGKDVSTVLDPTLLMTEQDWKKLSDQANGIDSIVLDPFILCYFVGENASVWEQVRTIQSKTGIQKVLVLPLEKEHYQEDLTNVETAGPAEFVRLLSEATLVCTDSYHATTLCLNLKKNFIAFLRFEKDDPRSQNSRIFELLVHYNLQDRFFESGNEQLYNAIDYESVHQLLKEDRKASLDFLTNALR